MTIVSQDSEATRARLAEIVGEANVAPPDAAAAFAVGGRTPLAVVTPGDEAQAAQVAGLALAERIPVTVWGRGSKQDVEPIQPTEGIVLRTAALDATVELDAANLTVTVGAGKVVDDLQRELAEARLFLPLDPVDSARATIGGTLAANTSGPNRLLYRTARDLLLGVRVATPLGTVIRAGGKTVKDVAGYDLKKLYIGSWGTLGAITAATFRLLPLPEAKATVTMVFPSLSDACSAVLTILSSFMRPSAAELLSRGAMDTGLEPLALASGEYLLMVQVEGATEDVERQERELHEVAQKHSAKVAITITGGSEAEVWKRRKGVFARPEPGRPVALVKGSVPIKRVVDFAGGVQALNTQGLDAAFAAHAGNGIVHAWVSAAAGKAERLVRAVEDLQRLAAEFGGFALLQKGPPEVVQKIRLWPPRTDYGLMRQIKAQLDPANLWNPARTPGGRI